MNKKPITPEEVKRSVTSRLAACFGSGKVRKTYYFGSGSRKEDRVVKCRVR